MQLHRRPARIQRGQVNLQVQMSAPLRHYVSSYENTSVAYISNRPFRFLQQPVRALPQERNGGQKSIALRLSKFHCYPEKR
jgi:hypothetical protein